MLFSNGRWIVSSAAWIYPVFFLRFLRLQKPARGFLVLLLTIAVINPIIFWKIIPAPINVYLLLACLAMQLTTLSFLADRLLATRLSGFISTLIFPAAWCSIEYVMSLIPSKGSWLALPYTQADNLSLMQLASVTGIWGISFLITWFASIVNWIWSQNFEWNKIRKGVIVFTSVSAAVMLFGTIRLNFFQPQTSSVLTASIVQPRDINKSLLTCSWTDSRSIGNYSAALETNLLEKTIQAAQAGAKIILWQEGAGWLPEQEESKFIERASQVASTEKIYLLMTLWTVPGGYPKHLVENKMVMINPDGTTQFVYIKSHPVSIEPIIKGNAIVPAITQTQYGRIAAAICFDGDFPNFIRQAGKNKTDILFLPANDWKEVDPLHTNMQITRAIENGFSLVHAAGQGLSVATDNRGKIISSLDYYATDKQVMYADVPVKQSLTIYTMIGDAFAWLCIAGFASAITLVAFNKRLSGKIVDTKNIKAGFAGQ